MRSSGRCCCMSVQSGGGHTRRGFRDAIHRVFHSNCGCSIRVDRVASARGYRRHLLGVMALACLTPLGSGSDARAGEVAVFVGEPSPGEEFGKAYGGSFSATFFRLVALEAEVARYPGILDEQGMTSFSTSAFLAPTIGFLTPYGGFGVGAFRQTLGPNDDNGTLTLFALGLKVRLGIVVLRAEYRTLGLSGEPLFPVEKRYSLGAGIDF